jgi:hypothetical protein
MKFATSNPPRDPKIVASQHEDSFPDVGSGDDSAPMNSLEILSMDIPLPERIMYIALDK